MNNSKKKFLSVVALATSAFVSLPFAGGLVSAAPVSEEPNYYLARPVIKPAYNNVVEVRNSRELSEALRNAKPNDIVRFKNDINLDCDLILDHSAQLDLGGHKLTVRKDGNIKIGKKTFSHKDKHEIYHPGYYRTVADDSYTYDGNGNRTGTKVTYRQIWVDGRTETVYTNVYNYDDSIDVLFKNGVIVKANGVDGRDGKTDVSSGYNGCNGETPAAPISIVSGKLRLGSIFVKGGKGGNGGNGGYQSLWHIPFGGGSAGNGGNGGNGGMAICLESDHAKYSLESDADLIKGKPGKGGKAGVPNPHYWIYRGWKGSDGRDGE